MANFDGGRLGLSPFYNADEVQNPFRGVFEEGVRQTGIDVAEGLTESRMREEGRLGEREWNAPVAGVEGGALSQTFGNYKMTPGSPSVSESNHWNYYQPEMQQDDEMAPPPVDPVENPAGALAASTSVRAYTGGGIGAVRPKPVPKPGDLAVQAQEQQGKQVMFDMNKIPKWQDSKAFNAGLLSFGLNLLSGNDWATSFNQAGAHFDKAYGREKREIWAQDLMAQGFDAHEVQAWIETGDQKALSDPMEKQMRQQQYALGQQQLSKALYENSDEMRQWQADREYNKDLQAARSLELQEMNTLDQMADRREGRAIRREELNMKKAAAAAKGNEWKKPEARDVVLSALQSGSNLPLANQRLSTLGGSIAKATSESPMLSHLVDQGFGGADAQEDKKVLSERRNFVQGPLRMATGAAYGPSEIDDYTTALFPTGSDFDKPEVMRRKQFMQDVVMGVAQGVSTGYRDSRLDMTHLKRAADDVASGAAKPIRSRSTGIIVGVQYPNGQVIEF